MKISELKQPYRRMAEYLVTQNCIQEASDGIYNLYKQGGIMDLFCKAIDKGHNPPITEEIKKRFPPDFDFSGEEEEVQNKKYDANFRYISYSCLLNEILPLIFNRRDILNSSDFNDWFNSDFMRFLFNTKKNVIKNSNVIYTQLAREGKFDELPDTCEFSEGVELEVMICNDEFKLAKVHGKFKGRFMCVMEDNTGYLIYKEVRLPSTTPKIDFSEFKAGDVVEVELSNEEKRIGWFDFTNNNHLYIRILQRKGNQICNGGSCAGTKIINKEKIKSITKIK